MSANLLALHAPLIAELKRGRNVRWKAMTVCSYHVAYAFQSEFTLYSCLNAKELLARSRREI